MARSGLADELVSTLTNPLDERAVQRQWISGLLGEHPSSYSRSPALWNAAYRELRLDATYAAFDVPPDKLAAFVHGLRLSPRILGINVTVPYKQALLPFLDDLDPIARAIGATNCVVRTPDGRLIGSNTDATGALACLIRDRPGAEPFFPGLSAATVLLVGTGGAGRAVASALLSQLGEDGRLVLANRTRSTAEDVAHAVAPTGGQVEVISEAELLAVAPRADLVVNASTRGQAGFFHRQDGLITCLEPYTPLGPASPAWIDPRTATEESAQRRAWYLASLEDVRANERAAADVLERMRPAASFFDLVYAPAESTFLRTARWSGHPTLNGSDMILHQAVAGFLIIARPLLSKAPADVEARVERAMRSA
ncbi:MAG TPA: shikimate dehydrogenase [Chloroflexota bacterium]|nr:shikimate dehydrogenase [Chloroflexota bacterium]